jgi:hypothetical protein
VVDQPHWGQSRLVVAAAALMEEEMSVQLLDAGELMPKNVEIVLMRVSSIIQAKTLA